MATESPVRLIGSSGSTNWPMNKDSSNFPTSTSNMAAQELGLLLNGDRFQGGKKFSVPSRSGSAPPSVDGSLASLRNLISQQSAGSDQSLENLSNVVESFESEEQLIADPAYLAYYSSNVNLNPRLPPPLISPETRRLVHHIGGYGENWRTLSFDDNNKGPLFVSRPALSTHKEEPEDDSSPKQEPSDRTDRNSGFASARFASPSKGRHKSLVDLIQEDFPRTPSPVYHNQSRPTNHGPAEASIAGVSSGHSGASPPSSLKGELKSGNVNLDNGGLVVSVPEPDIGSLESDMKNLRMSNDGHRGHNTRQHPQQNVSHPRAPPSQGQVGQSQMAGTRRSQNLVDPILHGQTKLASVEAQPVIQSTGLTPPLYATAAAYGGPYYSNLQPSSLFPPQYNVGGYALTAPIMQPFITGYTHNAIPLPVDNPSSPNFSPRISGVATGGNLPPGVDLQQFYKFYGQLGMAMQPSFPDPVYMSYFQPSPVEAYSGANQYDAIASRGTPVGGMPDTYDPQKGLMPASYSSDQRPQLIRTGANNPNPRKGGPGSPTIYGSPPNMGVFMQYPTSPLASPVYQGSPVHGAGFSGRRNETMRLPFSPGRNAANSAGWPGQRGRERVEDIKSPTFLEELKSSKGRRFELSEIAGRIVEFSSDQHGSRFIQQKLETCSAEEKASVFEEVLPHASTLMTDVFGNYVIQKFFEHGSPEQRKQLANQLAGHVLPLSLQMYGCRVIQKALEVIELDQKTSLVLELDGHVMQCVRDQNGNHVIQKCIECVPTERIGFIISAFRGQVATLSTHPYGCRVIQRVLEHCTDEMQSQCIIDEILQSAFLLAQDQYGNYVTQHVLEKGKPHERSLIINKLAGQVVQMSQHKFASNVIEKCLEYGNATEKELLIEEIVGQTEGNDNLLTMMKDQFANYVVQKILETCSDKQRESILERIRIHLPALKKYTYGKHIVVRVEQLSDEEGHQEM
ncbi:pumilio homolog 5 isoform X2 [Dioscorea cayenensis subsp. rotundata]|uniref:Pumilio homolog 5 isoform X2 n=1 Tax=Dioscorea cayennensis subsp. rotundata TaxID=55577 RepID=A0AB40C133_DIOCR|nr:pumilio homolog 5 isoform X2 [Dioscorea cayenensis subsp. rotundata]